MTERRNEESQKGKTEMVKEGRGIEGYKRLREVNKDKGG